MRKNTCLPKGIKPGSLSLLIAGLLWVGLAQAQNSSNASGGDATGSGGSAAYTVGQVVYTSASGTTGTSNQGVQQPYEFFATGIDDFPEIQLEMSAYPNPTRSVVNLRIDGQYQQGMNYRLFNANGQLITAAKIENSMTEIPMHGLAAGSYKLLILDTASTIKTFSIIKTH